MSALSPRQMYLLDSACHPLMEVFGWSTYLVGTAMQPRDGKAPRDIDVRTIVDDKQHDKLRKAIGQNGIAFLGIAVGQYLASLTGLPIDYQIQRMTEANALHDGPRNPLGHRNLDNYKGDAQHDDASIDVASPQEDADLQQDLAIATTVPNGAGIAAVRAQTLRDAATAITHAAGVRGRSTAYVWLLERAGEVR